MHLTLAGLSGDEGLDECVGGLGVQGQCIVEGLELRRLVKEVLFESTAIGMEVLLDGVQGSLQYCTLLGGEVPLKVLGDILLGQVSLAQSNIYFTPDKLFWIWEAETYNYRLLFPDKMPIKILLNYLNYTFLQTL